MTTDTITLDALAQSVANNETREGRDITEDEALAIARALAAIGHVGPLGAGSIMVAVARAAYAAGRASLEARVAELEAALRPVSEQSTSQEWMAETGATFEDIASGKSADWHAGYNAAIEAARAARKGGA